MSCAGASNPQPVGHSVGRAERDLNDAEPARLADA